MNITKIKSLNWKLRLFICIFITIICLMICNHLSFKFEKHELNYDYSQIYSINGVVTDIYTKVSWSLSRYGTPIHTHDYLDIKLENGKEITLSIYSKNDYFKGQNITVYTNGTDYDISEVGVVNNENQPVVYFILSLVSVVFIIIAWTILFEGKGIGIVLILLFIYYVIVS